MAGQSQDDDSEEELYGADTEDYYVEHACGLLGNVGERGGGVGCDVEAVRNSLDGFDAVMMQNEVKSSLRDIKRREETEMMAPLLLKQVFSSSLALVIPFSLGYLIWALGRGPVERQIPVSSLHEFRQSSSAAKRAEIVSARSCLVIVFLLLFLLSAPSATIFLDCAFMCFASTTREWPAIRLFYILIGFWLEQVHF